MKPISHLSELAALFLAVTSLPAVANASLYSKTSPVLQIDGRSYRSLIEKSNYSSIVEFYAPWCGHCKNLAPAYNKAATSLAGLANVAAVNCDEESNKPFCGQMGVQGFPTLKLVKPAGIKKDGKKGKAVVTDYQGPREAKDIIAAVKEKMPNHVTRVKDDNLDKWLDSDKPKTLIFGDKGLVPPLAKALAIDFLDQLDVGYARSGDAKTVKKYGISKFPTVVLISGKDKDPIVYEGEVNKASLLEFLSQAATPNPDATKSDSSKSKKKPTAKKTKAEKAEKAKATKADEKAEEKVEESDPHGSPSPDVTEDKPKPVDVRSQPKHSFKLATIDSESALQEKCMNSNSGVCVLVIASAETANDVEEAPLTSPLLPILGNIALNNHKKGRKLFPAYSVPEGNGVADALLKGLGLKSGEDKPVLLAVNAKRSWWSLYDEAEFEAGKVESWIESIRLGEHKKEDLPSSLIVDAKKEAAAEKKAEEVNAAEVTEEEAVEDDVETTSASHDEL